ncbi:MAG: hypothetical protein JO290_06225 [Sphingomonadaceae bacterium]|nr:hypothetical protein [Sphingomonadaceae bacterium]
MAIDDARRASDEALKTVVRDIVAYVGLSDKLQGIDIDPSDDAEPPFIRINLKLRKPETINTDRMIALQEAIEDALDKIDGRFASVRFPEAA